MFGKFVGTVVKFLVAISLFALVNTLLSNIASHTGFLSLNTWRVLQEGTRVLFVDNAFSATSIFYQDLLAIVEALTFICIASYGLFVQAFGETDEQRGAEQEDKREEKAQTVTRYSIVTYKQKVCFLS